MFGTRGCRTQQFGLLPLCRRCVRRGRRGTGITGNHAVCAHCIHHGGSQHQESVRLLVCAKTNLTVKPPAVDLSGYDEGATAVLREPTAEEAGALKMAAAPSS
jgi:hypothetical protein